MTYLTLTPTPPPPPSHWLGFDKVAHFGCWAAIAGLLVPWLALRGSGRVRPWLATGIATAYGGLIELVQIPVPGRSGDLLDWVADALGAIVGAFVAAGLWRQREPK